MGELLEMLNQCLNYFFPPNRYGGKKITDKRWVRIWVCLAPYTSIGLCVTMAIWGWLGNPGKPFMLTKQGASAVVVAFFGCILFLIAAALKKRHRSPAIPMLIANFFVLFQFLGLLMMTPMREKLEKERLTASQMVQARLQDRKDLMADLTQKKEEEVHKHFKETQKQIREIGDKIPDLSDMKEEIHAWREKCWEDATKRGEEAIERMKEAFAARSAKDEKQRRRELAKYFKEKHKEFLAPMFRLEPSDFEDEESDDKSTENTLSSNDQN